MQGSKKPPTSEVVESSKSDWRSERNTSPPSPLPRRDDRAEPDDDESTNSSRVDVVNVDGGGGRDSAASGMVSLRRELAKLHQQAAAVEKSLEDQRRDRSDSLDRLERATERVLFLESRLTSAEAETALLRKTHDGSLAELQALRAERDDLALAVEGAKASTADLGKLNDELLKARQESARALDDAKRFKIDAEKAREALNVAEGDAAMVGEQASKIRAEASKGAEELTKLRAEIAKSTSKGAEELTNARGEATRAGEELTKAREDAAKASEELTKARGEAAKAGEELTKAGEELTKAREELGKASEALTKASGELTEARAEAATTADELAKLREEIARAKEDNTRDRATARDRIDLIERALDDARAATARTESELEAARSNEERLGRQLEVALEAASQAESRASTTSMAHAALDLSVRRLREEIAGAFARVGHAGATHASAQIISIPQEMFEPSPDPVSSASGRVALRMPSDPPSADAHAEEEAASSPASQSVPPPDSASVAAAPEPPPAQGSMPPPTYASVPPQIHASSGSVAPPAKQTMPPPSQHNSMVAAARGWGGGRSSSPPPALAAQGSVPPGEHGSMPPTTRGSKLPIPMGSVPPAARGSVPPAARGSSPPSARGSVAPTAEELVLQARARQELLAKLVDPNHAEEAAIELPQRPEWLRGAPPPALIAALSNVDYNADGAMFDLARAWEREPLCHGLLGALRSESEPRLREHAAWLLKHLAAPSSWKSLAELAKSNEETVQLRRWLLEGLDRMAAGRAIGWVELGDVVTAVARHPDASLRDGVVGILLSLERSEEKRRLLLDILRTDDDEVVLASAVNALASVLPMELDPSVITRLLEHPSARVQRSVHDLVERAKHEKG